MGKFEKIKTDCVQVNLKNVGPAFFKFISICMKVHFQCSKIILVCQEAVILPINDFALPI